MRIPTASIVEIAAIPSSPQPHAIPIAATIHNVDAVVSPVTVNPCLKTVPAPIKPIPVIICAATLEGSPIG